MSENLILTIACSDKEPSIMISQVEYDRLVLIAQKAVALTNAQNKLESAVALTRARKQFERACEELHAAIAEDAG